MNSKELLVEDWTKTWKIKNGNWKDEEKRRKVVREMFLNMRQWLTPMENDPELLHVVEKAQDSFVIQTVDDITIQVMHCHDKIIGHGNIELCHWDESAQNVLCMARTDPNQRLGTLPMTEDLFFYFIRQVCQGHITTYTEPDEDQDIWVADLVAEAKARPPCENDDDRMTLVKQCGQGKTDTNKVNFNDLQWARLMVKELTFYKTLVRNSRDSVELMNNHLKYHSSRLHDILGDS